MVQVIWTKRASRCLSGIHAYIGADNPAAASATIRGILQKADLLRTFPQLGPVLEVGKRKGLRGLLYGHYRIVYDLVGEKPRILGVFHTSMDLRRLFGEGETNP